MLNLLRLNVIIFAALCFVSPGDVYGGTRETTLLECTNWFDEQKLSLTVAEKNYELGKRSIWESPDYAREKLDAAATAADFEKEEFTYIWTLCHDHLPDLSLEEARALNNRYVSLANNTDCLFQYLTFSRDFDKLIKEIDRYNKIVNEQTPSDQKPAAKAGENVFQMSEKAITDLFEIERYCRQKSNGLEDLQSSFHSRYYSPLFEINTFFEEHFGSGS